MKFINTYRWLLALGRRLLRSRPIPAARAVGSGPVGVAAVLIGLLALRAPIASGAPVTQDQASKAAATFIVKTYPVTSNALAQTITSAGSSPLGIRQVEPWVASGQTIGFIAALSPGGYVLLSADDDAPPVKLHSDNGAFDRLPPGLVAVLGTELSEDLNTLAAFKRSNTSPNPKYSQQWSALIDPSGHPVPMGILGPAGPNKVLLTTTWNQDSPYNYYCPAADGGPGGRAYAGCNACAMSQILRYCQQPAAVAQDYSDVDAKGACQGVFNISDVSMGAYDWTNMPNSIDGGSPDAKKHAIGRLMYQAAVAMSSDFEADETLASSYDAAFVFPDYFNYNVGLTADKPDYTDSQWYAMIAADIDAYRPIYYGMWNSSGKQGHVVVCDGYRNGNEMHLNLGWGGANNTCYNLDTVSAGGYTWTIHMAVFGITPPYIYVDGSYAGSDANGALVTPFPSVTDGCRAARSLTTVRIASGNYPETLTNSQPALLEAWNGIVRIGTR